MRTRRGLTSVGALLASAWLLAGCASLDEATPGGSPGPDAPVTDDDVDDSPAPGTEPSEQPSTTTGPASVPADLTIVLDESGEGDARTFTLTCDPTGGDHPDADAACAALAETWPGGFEPVPADTLCTQQYGGPQTATVEGTVDGRAVRASFSRTDGCEISRWEALAPLLGSIGGLL